MNAKSVKTYVIFSSDGTVSKKFAGANISSEIIPMAGYADIGASFQLAKVFKSQSIDIVHAHLGVDSFLGVMACRIARIPIVLSVHFDEPAYSGFPPIKRKVWQIIQMLKDTQVAHFLPITENVAHQLKKRERVSDNKITIVHPGIQPFTVNSDKRLRSRQAMGLKAEDLLLLGIGRLEIEKNFSCLIQAMKLLETKVGESRAKLWIVGKGSQREPLENLIQELNVSNVELLGYRSDVQDLLAAADVFILPSKAEPFGMAAVEAMFAELPVIGTRGPGLSTIVDDGITGLLVEKNDPVALAAAISKLCSDGELRKRLGSLGYERAIKCFSSQEMAEKILRVYKNVLMQ